MVDWQVVVPGTVTWHGVHSNDGNQWESPGPDDREEPTTMAISLSHFHVALHEAKHSAFGSSVGFCLTEIHVAASQGHVLWSDNFPVPEELARRWQQNPEATTIRVQHAVATLLSPHNGARFPTLCHDSMLVDQFGRAWYGLPTVRGIVPTPWLDLLRQARAVVRAWYQQPGIGCTLERLAHQLAQIGTLDAQAWMTLWQCEYGPRLRQPPSLWPVSVPVLTPVSVRVSTPSCSLYTK